MVAGDGDEWAKRRKGNERGKHYNKSAGLWHECKIAGTDLVVYNTRGLERDELANWQEGWQAGAGMVDGPLWELFVMLPTDLRKRGWESTICEGWSFLLADYRWLLPVLSAICKERSFLERMTSHPIAASLFSSSSLSLSLAFLISFICDTRKFRK